MKLHGKQSNIVIALDKCTSQLNTEKKRVYDIMNIFEGFGAVWRKAKNMYTWKGLKKVNQTIEDIQQKCAILSQNYGSKHNVFEEQKTDEILCSYKFERVKSLGFLCESFICLFILWKPVLTLEEAAVKISKVLLSDSKLKTKVRRLYDIANVLWVLKVVKKTLLKNGKPAFQWVGKNGVIELSTEIDSEAQSISKNHQEISENNLPILNPTLPVGFDHSSLDILEGIVKVLRKRLDDPSASSPQGALHSNL